MLDFSIQFDTQKKARESVNSTRAMRRLWSQSDADSFCIITQKMRFSRIMMWLPQLRLPEPKSRYPVGVFCRKDFPHLPMPLQVREYLSMRTILFMCFHMVGRGWFPDSLSRAIKSTGQVNTGGSVEPHADSILMGAYRKGNYCL